MKSVRQTVLAAAVVAAAVSALFITGCDTGGSPNTIERNLGVDYSGFYTGQNSSNRIASQNSGAPVTQFNLRQTGANLEVVDNNGALWKGDIGNAPDAQNLTATFTLNGKTTVGEQVTISGTITKSSAGATDAQMTGTWIEPNFYATVSAHGSVSATSTNSGGSGSFTISPPSTTVAIGQTATFSASGANGTVSWSASPAGFGQLSPNGNTASFLRSASGTVTITATASGGGSASATVN
jgi:hypothetical protein